MPKSLKDAAKQFVDSLDANPPKIERPAPSGSMMHKAAQMADNFVSSDYNPDDQVHVFENLLGRLQSIPGQVSNAAMDAVHSIPKQFDMFKLPVHQDLVAPVNPLPRYIDRVGYGASPHNYNVQDTNHSYDVLNAPLTPQDISSKDAQWKALSTPLSPQDMAARDAQWKALHAPQTDKAKQELNRLSSLMYPK